MDAERMRAVPLFASLTDEELYAIAPFAGELHVRAGTSVGQPGEAAQQVFAIVAGTVVVRHEGRTAAELGPGDVFGDMGVVSPASRAPTAVASTDARLITLTRWELRRMRRVMPHVVEEMRRRVERHRTPDGTAG
jgi:CRP/FNR family transcriptional regulator, cyclic AMP receptor protein